MQTHRSSDCCVLNLVHLRERVYKCMYVNVSMYVCMHACVCVCVRVHVRIYIYIYVGMHAFDVRMCVSVGFRPCMCSANTEIHGPGFL